jgi:hypothetical protein
MGRARSVLGGPSPTGADACAHIHARARGSACGSACAHSCVRARGPQRRGARTAAKGALSRREGVLSTREYEGARSTREYPPGRACVRPPTALRASGRARAVRGRRRVLTAHTARVPAVPREYWVSTVGGAAVKTTYDLIATACVPLLRLESLAAAAALIALVRLSSDSHSLCDVIRTMIAQCSYSVCGFIAIIIAHCAYSVDDLTRIIVSDSCSLCGLIAFNVTDKATACVTL